MTAQVFPAAPISFGRGGILPTPFQFLLTGEDRLRLSGVNVALGARVAVKGRILLDEDRRSPQSFETVVDVPDDDSEFTQDIDIGSGVILNVMLLAKDAVVLRGQCYMRLEVIRGSGPAAVVLGALIGGYIGSFGGRSWPGTPLEAASDGAGWERVVESSVPGVGAEPSMFIPAQVRWKIQSAYAQLTTSAVAGNRMAALEIIRSGDRVVYSPAHLATTASQVQPHTWGAGMAGSFGGGNLVGSIGPLPVDGIVMNGASLQGIVRTATFGLLGGDQWTALRLSVEEWRNPVRVV